MLSGCTGVYKYSRDDDGDWGKRKAEICDAVCYMVAPQELSKLIRLLTLTEPPPIQKAVYVLSQERSSAKVSTVAEIKILKNHEIAKQHMDFYVTKHATLTTLIVLPKPVSKAV